MSRVGYNTSMEAYVLVGNVEISRDIDINNKKA